MSENYPTNFLNKSSSTAFSLLAMITVAVILNWGFISKVIEGVMGGTIELGLGWVRGGARVQLQSNKIELGSNFPRHFKSLYIKLS